LHRQVIFAQPFISVFGESNPLDGIQLAVCAGSAYNKTADFIFLKASLNYSLAYQKLWMPRFLIPYL
jgi:hypothetical protein